MGCISGGKKIEINLNVTSKNEKDLEISEFKIEERNDLHKECDQKTKKSPSRSFKSKNSGSLNTSLLSLSPDTKRRSKLKTLVVLEKQDVMDSNIIDFAKINKAIHPEMIEIKVKANEFKFAKWIPVVTRPNQNISVFAQGKWTIDESKHYVSHKGYSNKNIGNLTVSVMGLEEEIQVNDINYSFSTLHKLPLVLGFNCGKYLNYRPDGSLKLKILGCKQVSQELALPNYCNFCKTISFATEMQLNEEIIQIVYFIESFRTASSLIFKKYRSNCADGLEYKDNLSELARMFLNAKLKDNLTEDFVVNSKKAVNHEEKVEFISQSYSKEHDSPYLKVLKLVRDQEKSRILSSTKFGKLGVALISGKLGAVHLGLILSY